MAPRVLETMAPYFILLSTFTRYKRKPNIRHFVFSVMLNIAVVSTYYHKKMWVHQHIHQPTKFPIITISVQQSSPSTHQVAEQASNQLITIISDNKQKVESDRNPAHRQLNNKKSNFRAPMPGLYKFILTTVQKSETTVICF